MYGKCRRTADCYFGNFCNFGICVPTLEFGVRCNGHDGCGRKGLCLYNDTINPYGFCIEMLSLDAEEPVLGKAVSSSSFGIILR